MFNIVLLESSISLLPKRFWNWPEAKAYHRRFGVPPERQILDISFHYDIVRTLKNPKLGRPDIVHLTLLSVFAIPLRSWARFTFTLSRGPSTRSLRRLGCPRTTSAFSV